MGMAHCASSSHEEKSQFASLILKISTAMAREDTGVSGSKGSASPPAIHMIVDWLFLTTRAHPEAAVPLSTFAIEIMLIPKYLLDEATVQPVETILKALAEFGRPADEAATVGHTPMLALLVEQLFILQGELAMCDIVGVPPIQSLDV